jgi:hypothetical protein
MAIELLAVQEENLEDFIFILRCGIEYSQKISLDPTVPKREVPSHVLNSLAKWCDEMEIYLTLQEDAQMMDEHIMSSDYRTIKRME